MGLGLTLRWIGKHLRGILLTAGALWLLWFFINPNTCLSKTAQFLEWCLWAGGQLATFAASLF